MDDLDYETAHKVAKINFEKIEKLTPDKIKKRESNLFIKFSKTKGNSLTLLEKLYSEMTILFSHIGKYAQCKKGCSHCCHYEVALSDLEIDYILKNTIAKLIKDDAVLENKNQACPFLKQNKCSIYDFRPFVCRRHYSISDSPKWCESSICHDYEFPLVSLSEVDKTYGYIITNSEKDNIKKDIRLVFKKM